MCTFVPGQASGSLTPQWSATRSGFTDLPGVQFAAPVTYTDSGTESQQRQKQNKTKQSLALCPRWPMSVQHRCAVCSECAACTQRQYRLEDRARPDNVYVTRHVGLSISPLYRLICQIAIWEAFEDLLKVNLCWIVVGIHACIQRVVFIKLKQSDMLLYSWGRVGHFWTQSGYIFEGNEWNCVMAWQGKC
jgi:hypothetical protein